ASRSVVVDGEGRSAADLASGAFATIANDLVLVGPPVIVDVVTRDDVIAGAAAVVASDTPFTTHGARATERDDQRKHLRAGSNRGSREPRVDEGHGDPTEVPRDGLEGPELARRSLDQERDEHFVGNLRAERLRGACLVPRRGAIAGTEELRRVGESR